MKCLFLLLCRIVFSLCVVFDSRMLRLVRFVGWNWKNFMFFSGSFWCNVMFMLLLVRVWVFEVVLKILSVLLVVRMIVLDWKMWILLVVSL